MGEQTLSLHLDDNLHQSLVEEARRREIAEAVLAEAVREADKGVFFAQGAMDRGIDNWGSERELPPLEPDVLLPPKER